MIILLHSSKTMRVPPHAARATSPEFLAEAALLRQKITALSTEELTKIMHISPALAAKTHQQFEDWNTDSLRFPAIDSFIGDIYSGFQPLTLSSDDRRYAQDVLRILSGLYGVLRPLDAVLPYRLEMGYKLPFVKNLYDFWGNKIAASLPEGPIINTSSEEYSKVVTPFIEQSRIITPRFLTIKNDSPEFVVVHAKIARGAFASWMIRHRIEDIKNLPQFDELGYAYDASLSTPGEPVFVCQVFGGKGLSIRLQP